MSIFFSLPRDARIKTDKNAQHYANDDVYICTVDIKFFKHVSGTVARVFCKFLSCWSCSRLPLQVYSAYGLAIPIGPRKTI